MNFFCPYLPCRDEAPKPTTALDYTFGRRAKTGHNIVSCLRRKTFQLSSEPASLGLLNGGHVINFFSFSNHLALYRIISKWFIAKES